MFGCVRALFPCSAHAGLLLACIVTAMACGAADDPGGGEPKGGSRVDGGAEDAGVVRGSDDGGEPPQKDSDESPAVVGDGDAGTVDLSELLKRILPPLPISPIPPPRPPG